MRRITNGLKQLHHFVVRILASNKFFLGVIILFAIQCVWVATSNSYPMIFDEEFHMGVTDIYSRQWSPFIGTQPSDAAFYGDITRLTSYFMHWVLSFPYRLVEVFGGGLVAQIVTLRFINIGFVIAALFAWRAFLVHYAKLSKPVVHTALLATTLIPLFVYVSSQVNYDNVMILLVPLLLIAAVKTIRTDKTLQWLLVSMGLAGIMTVVKFTALPIVLVVALYIAGSLVYRDRKRVFTALAASARHTRRALLIILVLFAGVGVALFVERYGGNYIQYGSLRPSCEEIQTRETCSQYNVWIRNERLRNNYTPGDRDLWNPLEFTAYRWAPHIYNDLFVTASFPNAVTELHRPIPEGLRASLGNDTVRYGVLAVVTVGVIGMLAFWRRLDLAAYLFLAILLVYASSLWSLNWSGYNRVGQPLATQGRYFLLFLPAMAALVTWGLSRLIRPHYLKTPALLLILLLFSQGSGALAYVVYSKPSWQWDHLNAIQRNETARKILGPLPRL